MTSKPNGRPSRRTSLFARHLAKVALLAPLLVPTVSHGLGFPFVYDLPPMDWGTICDWTHGTQELVESNQVCGGTITTNSGALVTARAAASVTPLPDTALIRFNAFAAGSAVDDISGGGTGMVAGGFAQYLFGFLAIAPTPHPIDKVPLDVTVSATFKVEGGAYGMLSVTLDGDSLLAERVSRGQGTRYELATLWFEPLSLHLISKGGSCTASVNLPYVDNGSCEMTIDPVLSFDQAAFDALMGSSTFALDEYFAIRLSESLAPVPEPSVVSLMLAGIALLGLHRRKSFSHGHRRR